MKEFNEKEFTNDWNSFWENMEKAELTSFYKEEGLKNVLMEAPGAIDEDSGTAYPGGLIRHIVLSTALAQRVAKMVANTFTIDEKSLLKVCLLLHLSKIGMYVKNDNDWEVKNRGKYYKFSDLSGRLKFGERSILQAMNRGIKLEPTEFEAMRCIDRKNEDNRVSELFDDILSIIVRQANELAYAIEKKKA